MAYNISKYYRNILGLDLRISDLLRNQNAATEAKNIIYRQTGALSKRNGFQINVESDVGGAGLIKFNDIDLGTGIITEKLLNIDDNLELFVEQQAILQYSGSGTAYFDLYLDAALGTFTFDLFEDNLNVLSVDLGTGEGASDTTIDQLATAIDAITGFITTFTPDSSPAAFVTLSRYTELAAASFPNIVFTHNVWSTVPSTGSYTTPFTSHWAKRNSADFEIAK